MYRLAEIAGSLSMLTAVADGFALDKPVRTSLLATALGRTAGWTGARLSDLYYAAVLRFAGCTGFAFEDTELNAGDDIGLRTTMATADLGDPGQFVTTVRAGLGRHRPEPERAAIADGVLGDVAVAARHGRSQCDAAIHVARHLGMGPDVLQALDHKEERWDGRGVPDGVAGPDLSPLARLVAVADFAEIFHRIGGREAAVELLRARRAAHFDPDAVDLFLRHTDELFPHIEEPSPWTRWLAAEPAPRRIVGDDALEGISLAFAAFVDLKSRWFLGHSTEVARLAERAAPRLGVDPRTVRLAGRLHDLGRVGVSNLVWDKPGPLDALERAQAESHVPLTVRALERSPLLAPFAVLAGGLHRSGGRPQAEAALLAAADAWCALVASRPWRAAYPPEEAARILEAEARAGTFDGDAVAAVIAAAGGPARRASWPEGLSRREVDVLRAVAQGLSNKEIAAALDLSPKTVERHVTRLYARIGARSRAAAALWALEHGLLRA